MHRHLILFAQSFLGGTFEWIASGVEETATFARDWVTSAFNARVFGIITAVVIVVAIFARIHSGRRL